MRILIIIFSILLFSQTKAENNLNFYTLKALDNNLQLNAERKKLEAAKQSKNISRSEFYPSLTISGNQTSTTTTNRINQSGSILADTNLDSETKSIELEQVIFSGFKGINIFKKSELETQKAKLELKNVEQKTISDTAKAYFDLIYNFKNEKFNLSNVKLFERQVEVDNARVQKGEITLTDLAQSESSLAGANADLIKAKTEYFTSKTNFERITGVKAPNPEYLDQKIILNLPNTLKSSLDLANLNNIELLISKLDYEISIKDLNIERSRLSPSASINVSKTESKDFSSSIDEKDDESVKATITWPIIKGGENVSAIKKSSFNKQRAELLLQDANKSVKTETANHWSDFKSFKGVLEATKAQLKAAEIANEGISLEYDTGITRTTLEVIQSRSLLLDARISHAKAERDFIISQFELAKQIGRLSIKSFN